MLTIPRPVAILLFFYTSFAFRLYSSAHQPLYIFNATYPQYSSSTPMKKTSTDSQSISDRVRSWARTKAHGPSPLSPTTRRPSVLPVNNQDIHDDNANDKDVPTSTTNSEGLPASNTNANVIPDDTSRVAPPPAPPPQADGPGTVIEDEPVKKNVATRFYLTAKGIIFSSWVNVLLIFVPVGIAVKCAGVNPTIIFAMNAIAIIPLAGLLSHATESVAKRMGDTVGALMNVTFGNAVELIILYVLWWFVAIILTLPACMSS